MPRPKNQDSERASTAEVPDRSGHTSADPKAEVHPTAGDQTDVEQKPVAPEGEAPKPEDRPRSRFTFANREQKQG